MTVTVIGDPVFDGPLGELDRRSGGELSGLVAFGEIPTRRYYRVVAASGDLPFQRLVVVSGGKADEFDWLEHLGAKTSLAKITPRRVKGSPRSTSRGR